MLNKKETKVKFLEKLSLHAHLKNLRTKEAELPPTQLNPKAGSGKLV